ncbi:MAG: DNA polymerase I [Flavobacteriia bacterium]|nr:MAG: DNA polymerase I [Flavobacteriia bacterium]
MSQKRLFLLDAYALIFRGYYAFIKNPRINSKGMDTSAIMGFMNSLLDIIRKERPDHLAVAFDKGGSVARSEAFPAYKANRDETPEAIRIAVPYIHQILEAMEIPIIEKAGFEADDLIGTLAKQAEKEGYQTFMVTPDKDFAQLVSDNIFMYKPARMGNGVEIWGIPEVQKKFEVEQPEQVIDYLGMMGDSVDNIPGLPGVGDKTAKKFIKAYGSLENLLANTHELKGKMKEKVEANADLGRLSKQLATIITDCPVTFHEKDFELSQPDVDKVQGLFQELEFRRMWQTFNSIFQPQSPETDSATTPDKSPKTPQTPSNTSGQLGLFDALNQNDTGALPDTGLKNIDNTPHFYQYVDSDLGLKLLVKNLLQQTSVCFDTETTGLDTFTAELVGIAFSYDTGKGYYVHLPEERQKAQDILEQLKPFFEAENIEKIGQNLKFDLKILHQYGITVKGSLFDTMIAHYLLQPDMRHNMDVLAETYLNYHPVPIETLIGKKGKNQRSMRTVDLDKQTEYAVEDADITYQLKQIFEPQLTEAKLKDLFDQIEMPLVRVLTAMELEGIKLDKDFLNSLLKDLNHDIIELESKIFRLADAEFNIGSPQQLGGILFDRLKIIDKPKKTKTGQYATGEEILSNLVDKHPIVQHILDWRGLVKLKNTYVEALPKQVNPKTGHIHTTFSQAVAATGRLSSNDPNLQNIPIRTERGQQIRKAFVPRNDDFILVDADYSQIELRIIASLSGEKNMIQAFKNGEDIHRSTAAKVFNIPPDAVTKEQRSHAKTVNFGIIYGVSAFGLSQQTTLNRTDAKALIDAYYDTYPTLKTYISQQIHTAREKGYVTTVLGRRRYLKNINSRNNVVRSAEERNAVNAPIQGSAADIIKIAMINLHQKLEAGNYRSKMLLQVHDELVFDVYKPELETLKKLIKDTMENAYKLAVPLDADMNTGNNWLEAH